MKYIKIELTEEQKANFLKLAFHLYNLIQTEVLDFDMDTFQNKTDCGTSACACGYGPQAGVKKKVGGEEWLEYADRCFTHGSVMIFHWCFSSNWRYCDNTPKGAAKRIFMLLEHGIPEYNTYNPDIYKSYEPKYLEIRKN